MSNKKTDKQKLHEELDWESALTAEDTRLIQEPRKLWRELYRAFKIFLESARGFFAFRKIYDCITVFGSARFHENHEYYEMARNVGRKLAENKFAVMTGGGPGIMEAANRGAKEGKGLSIGCNISIPEEQEPNPYLDKWITFKYFFVRKVMLTINSSGFIVCPGGFGTLDEFFEMATLIQTEKIDNFPVVLMGKKYWQPMLDFMHDTMATHGTIDYADAQKILITDSPEEAINFIIDAQKR